jgi:hypothetical protein
MCSLSVKSPHEICGPLCLSPMSPNMWQNNTLNYCITTFISIPIHCSLASSYSILDNLGYCKCNQTQQACLVWRFVLCGFAYSQNNYRDQSCTWCSFLAHLWLQLHSDYRSGHICVNASLTGYTDILYHEIYVSCAAHNLFFILLLSGTKYIWEVWCTRWWRIVEERKQEKCVC